MPSHVPSPHSATLQLVCLLAATLIFATGAGRTRKDVPAAVGQEVVEQQQVRQEFVEQQQVRQEFVEQQQVRQEFVEQQQVRQEFVEQRPIYQEVIEPPPNRPEVVEKPPIRREAMDTHGGFDPATQTGVTRDPQWRTCNSEPVLQNEALARRVPGVYAPLSEAELEVYRRLMEERAKAGLAPIPVSPSLTAVARAHVWDSAQTPASGACNLHSWSTTGAPWEPFCYTSDHAQMRKMHRMPAQLVGFHADAFENSASGSPVIQPQRTVDGWMRSAGHRALILNTGIWDDNEWRAIGIAIEGNYAHLWVSECADGALFPQQ